MPLKLAAILLACLLPGLSLAEPVVQINTNMGAITVELNSAKAPKTVANFLEYVKSGHYSGTIFHRVIPGFMIQGGGLTRDLREKPTRQPIMNEADNGLRNEVGTISMARTSDPHSASAQFFINVANNGFLNHTAKDERGWGYAVFGKVVQGMDVVDRIANVPTSSDVPVKPVVIESVVVKKP